jgi:acetyl-CoA acetyltransferase
MSLFERGAVAGIGETAYSRNSGRSVIALQCEASLRAIQDAGLSPRDIDGIISYGSDAVAEDLVTNFGIPDLRFCASVPMGGASSVAGLQLAISVIASGICRHVLMPVGRNGASGARVGRRMLATPQFRLMAEHEAPIGAMAPAQLYAPMARRHMELYGTRSRHLGAIAVSTRQHAMRNPRALKRDPMTIEDHQQSRMIADPFRLFDCCLESDGAAAIVVTSTERARDLRSRPVIVMGLAEGHPDSPSSITQRDDVTRLGLAKAAPRAFSMAGVSPADIQVAEIYDCFTYIVLCQLEDLGFCKKGEGGTFVESGVIAPGGKLPVNTHGGLLSEAHVAGMNHIVELVRQLRGEAGATQVQDAQIGLVTGYGDMGNGSVAIMRSA